MNGVKMRWMNVRGKVRHISLKLPAMGMMKKVIIGYIFIVILPVCILGTFVYKMFYNEMLKDYMVGKQQLVENAYVNLKVNMTQIEGLYYVIEYNQNIIEYLSGFYDSDSELVYNYVTYIKPLLEYIRTSNPSIEDIKIYKSYMNVVSFKPEFININEMQENAEILSKIGFSGLWAYENENVDEVPRLKYYQKIYDARFVNVLGVMEISIKSSMVAQFLDSLKASNSHYKCLLNGEKQIVYRNSEVKNNFSQDQLNSLYEEIGSSEANYFYLSGSSMVVNTLNIHELGMKAVVFSSAKDKFTQPRKEMGYMFTIIAFLLLVLSAIYYFTASSITKRILKLAKHMRKVGEKNLSQYHGEMGQDEIGFLVSSYNSMINRIDELVNTVHRTEILRKEAAYAALQAQIKPHFLYNTLESLRMMAQSNNDTEVADMCFSFGRLIRYCLSKENDSTLLKNEITNIDNYLKICKIRMGDRLRYEFDIQADIDSFLCPKFILQPVVENSIMHGLSKCRKEGLLKVRIMEEDGFLFIQISDNGQGIEKERFMQIQDLLNNKVDPKSLQTNEGGFGTYNVNERIKSFFGVESGLFIESLEGIGTTCTLKLRNLDKTA